MIKKNNIQIFLIIGIFICFSLSCNESITESQSSENLLSNGSFEINGQPSLNGWRFGNKGLAELTNQAAPNGGNWSLQLTSDWAPTTGFIYTPVTNIKSQDIITLSAYVRATGQFGGGGIINLVTGQSIYSGRIKSISTSDTVWNQISVTDTVKLNTNDTLWVVLSSLHTELVPFKGLFDLVKIEKY